jgi:predicted neuraminidase
MVYNDTEDSRHSLAVSVSDDEGTTWKWTKHLEQAAEGETAFAYPSVIQARNGRVHVTYSYHAKDSAAIKHAAFDPNWVTSE